MYVKSLLTAAFVVYACFQIFLREDFEEGRRWGGIAMEILDANSAFTPSECTNVSSQEKC